MTSTRKANAAATAKKATRKSTAKSTAKKTANRSTAKRAAANKAARKSTAKTVTTPVANPWTAALAASYSRTIDQFRETIRRCPDEQWGASVWTVKATDPHAWPIDSGLGADLPDGARLQLQSAFWNVAYHAIFHLDYYMEGGWTSSYEPPEPFRIDDHYGGLPWRVYTKAELDEYLSYCAAKAEALLTDMSDESAREPRHNLPSFAELLIGNLLHVADHMSQLNLFLGTA